MTLKNLNTKDTNFFKLVSLILFSIGLILTSFSIGLKQIIPGSSLKIGAYILKNKKIPTSDIFSWLDTKKLFSVYDKWLNDVITYFIYSFSHRTGIYILTIILTIVIALILINFNKNNLGKNYFPVLLLLTFLVLTITKNISFGGDIFILLLFTIQIYILKKYFSDNSKLYILLPVISFLWANIQGDSSNLFYLVCLIFIFTSLFEKDYSWIEFKIQKNVSLLITTGISLLTMAINPYGFKIFLYPYQSILPEIVQNNLTRYANPNSKTLASLICCIIPLLLIVLVFITTQKKIKATDFILFGFWGILSLRSEAYSMFLLISAEFYIFQYIPSLDCITSKGKKIIKVPALNIRLLFIALISIGMMASGLALTITTPKVLKNKSFMRNFVDEKMINYVKKDNPKRLYNTIDTGNDLIVNDIKVFIDYRYVPYVKYNLKDYTAFSLLLLKDQHNLSLVDKGVNQKNLIDYYLNKYKFDKLLVYKDTPVYQYLVNNPKKYQLMYDTTNYAYFKPNK